MTLSRPAHGALRPPDGPVWSRDCNFPRRLRKNRREPHLSTEEKKKKRRPATAASPPSYLLVLAIPGSAASQSKHLSPVICALLSFSLVFPREVAGKHSVKSSALASPPSPPRSRRGYSVSLISEGRVEVDQIQRVSDLVRVALSPAVTRFEPTDELPRDDSIRACSRVCDQEKRYRSVGKQARMVC